MIFTNISYISGVLEKWESLTARMEETQMAGALHRELIALRTEFKAAHDRLFSYEITLEQPHVLDERINRITVRTLHFYCCNRIIILAVTLWDIIREVFLTIFLTVSLLL